MPTTFAPHHASAASRDALESALAGLDLSWSVLGGLALGAPPDEVSIDFIVLHPRRGIALIDAAPGGGADTLARFRAFLAAERFDRHYPGWLPIIHLRLGAEEAEEIGERLEATFSRAPPITIRDDRWVHALTDLLTSEPEAVVPAPPMERRRDPFEPGAAFARAADDARRPQRRPALRARARRVGVPAAALALLLGAGVGVAAVHWSGKADLLAYLTPKTASEEVSLAARDDAAQAEATTPAPAPVEAASPPIAEPSPPPQATAPSPPAAKPPAQTMAPPPLPPAPPPRAVATAKPAGQAAAPPPAPPAAAPSSNVAAVPAPTPNPPPPVTKEALATPKPVPAEQLPPIPTPKPAFVPPESPPAVAKAPEPPQPRQAPPAVAKASEPAPKAAPPAPPPQTASREPEPEPAAEAPPRQTATRGGGPIPLRPGSSIPHGGPPIDATDLPPLGEGGPRTYNAPAQESAFRRDAPRVAAGSGPSAAAVTLGGGASSSSECRPYVADTTITGASRPVSGLACRQADGRWKLVTERPQQ